ncbi:hypothetical protein EJ04DRAFT_594328 [Polyplosphaeria fusca]|uniref:Uncharacterized protein n=1 Tax=Polyplosphaeria fusca TaxID=682080 RepID=A0A9P4QME5_9PLEO|nr:hypothetical protein EJ04DRAFT_594328 [Polyplosphaeria fusca]
MHFTPTILSLTALSSLTSAFVIDTFKDENCASLNQAGVNIWDNTCATWPEAHMSFKIKAWGGVQQAGFWFTEDGCGNILNPIKSGWVDSTSTSFSRETCYSFNGAVSNAIASYYHSP